MANFIRISHASLAVIPVEHRLTIHSMYEDNDLDGAEHAEKIVDFIEQETPGSFVAILANDSVTPGCIDKDYEHYTCDHYVPYWYTVLIASSIWEQYKGAVLAKDQEWKDAHGCKVAK
jgi:hypothetical protein